MPDLLKHRRIAVAVLLVVTSVWSSQPVLAKSGSAHDNSNYQPRLPTKDLDPAALDVIRRFSKWPGSYPAARRALLRLGWQPDPKVDCLNAPFLLFDKSKSCRDDPNDIACKFCSAMPEIETCSQGVEYCIANFVHPNSQAVLQITTGGDLQGHGDDTAIEGFTFIGKSDPDR